MKDQKKKLLIAIDPGFDGGKIVINNSLVLNVPYVAQDITSAEMDDSVIRADSANYICYDNGGRKYCVGSFAKRSMLDVRRANTEDKYRIASFYDVRRRFSSEEFKICFESIIGYALIRYEEATKKTESPFTCSDLLNYDLIIGIALPHEHLKALWEEMKPFVNGEHEFNLTVGLQKSRKFKFTFAKSMAYSQALSAFYCAMANNDGSNRYPLDSFAPAIVILAGYKTLERFEYSRTGVILVGDDNNPSNEVYAMYNVNHDVVERIQREIPGSTVTEYEIESSIYSGKETFNVLDADKNLVAVPVAAYRKEALKKKCLEMIENTRENFDYFRTTSTILVAGGTGAQYYEYIKDWCDSQDALKGKAILVAEEINGVTYDSVYAVAIGLAKILKDNYA